MPKRYGWNGRLQMEMPKDYYIDFSYTNRMNPPISAENGWVYQFDQPDGTMSKTREQARQIFNLQCEYGCINVTSGPRKGSAADTYGVWVLPGRVEHRPDKVHDDGHVSKMCRCFG